MIQKPEDLPADMNNAGPCEIRVDVVGDEKRHPRTWYQVWGFFV